MTEFAKGGIVRGEAQVYAKLVDYPSWGREARFPVNNSLWVIYADECLIGRDKVCLRKDEIHKRFKPPDSQVDPFNAEVHHRFWYCPSHDEEDRRGKPPKDSSSPTILPGPEL